MLLRVLLTAGLHNLREPAVNKVFPHNMFSHDHPAIYRSARIHIQLKEYLAAKIRVISLLHIKAGKIFEPLP